MLAKAISMVLAVSLTCSLGLYVPMVINQFNDNTFGNITILDNPSLLKALKEVQAKGVAMCVHGWRHEDFSTLTAPEAEQAVEKSIEVFNKAGLIPVAFLSPYAEYVTLPPSIRAAIASTGIATSLPNLEQTNGSFVDDYGWGWRTMISFRDARYNKTLDNMIERRPTTIITHVEDWNIFLKQVICDYLQAAHPINVTIRVDDIEVNTPVAAIFDMAEMYNYSSIGLIAYGVISAGTWRGGDPTISRINVNSIFNVYWIFFCVAAFFPFSFLFIWRGLSHRGSKSKASKDSHPDCPPSDDPPQNRKQQVSIVVPAYNEEKYIAKCMEAILKQDFVGEMEIILVNDGSTDKTGEIAAKYPVKVINLPANRGKAHALNIGIENASGNIIIFSDADSEMSTTAVTSLVKCLEEHPDIDAVAGNVFINSVDEKRSILKSFQEIEYRVEQEVTRYLQSVEGNVLVCPGPLFAVKRQVTERTRFSDITVVEDADFTIQILSQSKKIIRESKAEVYTRAPKSLGNWVNQRKRWWYGNLQLWRLNKSWATGNSWMILNYLSFPTSILSIILMSLLPYLILNYDNVNLMLLRGILWIIVPWILFIVFTIPLFTKRNRKLIPMLVPYYMIYGTMKAVMLSYLYICYLSRIGVKVRFGSRTIRVK